MTAARSLVPSPAGSLFSSIMTSKNSRRASSTPVKLALLDLIVDHAGCLHKGFLYTLSGLCGGLGEHQGVLLSKLFALTSGDLALIL